MSDDLLQRIVEATPAGASSALGWYLNAHFHQDQHNSETWKVVAPLVELLRSRSPAIDVASQTK